MTALIVRSLKQNAGAELLIKPERDTGMQATIISSRTDAAPESDDTAE